MDNFSTTGYKDDSPHKNRSSNIIPGNLITMQGVSRKLTLVPIVNGKPQYDRKREANPGDEDIQFEDDVEGVLELPNSQMGSFAGIDPRIFQQNINPINQMNQGLDYGMGGDSSNLTNNLNTHQPYQQSGIPYNGAAPTNLPIPTAPTLYPNNSAGNYNPQDRANTMGLGTQSMQQLGMNGLTDPNDAQMAEASIVKARQEEKKKNSPFIGAINPYGTWNMNNASTALGASIESGNTLGIIGGAGKLLLAGTRNALGGAAAMKVYNEGRNEYETELEERERMLGMKYAQKGGSVGHMLTGNFIEGDDNHSNPNTEVEKGEYVQTPDGQTMEVMGDRHSTGGELLNLPGGTKVISDYLKIGSKLATFFKKEFNLNVKSTTKFASVLDKYKKKIGLTELLEDETKLMNKLNDQEEVEFEGTREINQQVLSEKINEIQPQKEKLNTLFENFTNVVFEKQEESKGPEDQDMSMKQAGGEIDPQMGQEQQEGGSEIEQLITMYAQMTGQDPMQIIQQLQQLPEEELQQAVEQMAQAVQQGMSQQEGQPQGGQEQQMQEQPQEQQMVEQPMMKIGGAVKFLQNQKVEYAAEGMETGGPGDGIPELIQSTMIAMGIPIDKKDPTGKEGETLLENLIWNSRQKGLNKSNLYGVLLSNSPKKEYFPKTYKEFTSSRLKDQLFQGIDPFERIDKNYKAPTQADVKTETPSTVSNTKAARQMLSKDGDNYKYNSQLIRQGKSILGGKDVDGESYNPGSQQSVEEFMQDADTTTLWNPNYNTKDLRTALSNAKTDQERYKILNDYGQKNRQKAFLENAGESISSYVGMGYAPVQSQLQKVYDTLPGDVEKKEFSKVLKDSGWGIDKGKIFGGNYKYNSQYKSGDPLYEYMNNKLDYKIANEIGIQNINDGVYDRRRERFEAAEFKDQESMDSFASSNGFRTFKDKLGRTVWIDPNNRNNIILPTIGGKPKEADVETPEVPKTSEMEPLGNLDQPNGPDLPMLTPDQSNLRPSLLQPGLRTFTHVQANPINISPEETLKELNKQYNTASRLSSETNPYTSGAMQADLQAKSNNAINQAYSQAAIANAQDERNVENTNEQRIQQRENQNIGALNQYEQLSQIALDNYKKEWMSYIDKNNLENLNSWNLENQRQAFNAVNDNYKIGSQGWYMTNQSPIINLPNGMMMTKDPKTGEYYEVKKTTETDGQKTVTKSGTQAPNTVNVKKSKKGGLLLKKGINIYLK